MPDPRQDTATTGGRVVVGLVATPPDHPAQVAGRLAGDLAHLLGARVDGPTRWVVRTGWGAVAPRRDRGAEALLDDVARRREDEGWDIAVCLTDMPFVAGRVPLVAHASARRQVGVLSLPALGLGQLRAARTAVPGLVEGLLGGWSDRPGTHRSGADRSVADRAGADRAGADRAGAERSAGVRRPGRLDRMVAGVAPIRRVADPADDGEVTFVASRLGGRLRLLVGMVRANNPGRALLGLSKLLVGAFGTAALALTAETIWEIGDALDGLRLTVIMLLALTGLVAWLVVAHDLWERPSEDTPRELARLFNIGTVVTLALATMLTYAVLFAGTALAAALLIDPSVLGRALGRPVGPADYATLAWIISSMATVGGAIGSGLEDEEHVRAAAYGYHPDPVGSERGDDDGDDGDGDGDDGEPRDR